MKLRSFIHFIRVMIISGCFICFFQSLPYAEQAIGNNFKDQSSDVRLQDNGYLRIIGKPVVFRYYSLVDKLENPIMIEMTIEKINELIKEGKFPPMKESEKKELVESMNESKMKAFKKDQHFVRMINVEVQFLKPCIASYDEEQKGGDFLDSLYLKFKCNYRFKVFATFFDENGFEIETVGEYLPVLYSTDRSYKIETEMVPGEKRNKFFSIPSQAKSWQAWVPK